MKKTSKSSLIESFHLEPGELLVGKYEVISLLGKGWEGEVYKLQEIATGIERAGKFFYPYRNLNNRTLRRYAQKLHKLKNFPILIQYHAHESFTLQGQEVMFLVSELVEGETLDLFLAKQPGKRLTVFEGIHLLYALASGMEGIHNVREYHGDLHPGNIIITRHGISFEIKLLDFFDYGRGKQEDLSDDVCDLVRIFYDAIGGKKYYARQPEIAKQICRGLKRTLILSQFRNAGQLRQFLETMEWE